MVWDFTPTQVMKGEIKYELDDFRRDLFTQVTFNFGDQLPPEKTRLSCDLFWSFCHMGAIRLSLDEIEKCLSGSHKSVSREFLKLMQETCQVDAEMLAAIYQNLILKFFTAALKDSLVDENKAINRAIALLNLYVIKHLNL